MSRSGRLSPESQAWRLLALVACAGTAATLVVALSPAVRFAYRAPELHVALETANAAVALLAGLLFLGRHRSSRRAADLLVALSLCTVAVANLLLTALPDALTPDRTSGVTLWAPVAVRLFGTSLLAAAALVPPGLRTPGVRRPAVLVAVTVALVTTSALLLGSRLPPPIDPGAGLDGGVRPLVTGHPVLLAVQALSAVGYVVAALVFARRGARDTDPLLGWLGIGCVLAAFARVHYLLFPSLYTEYVYTGDLLRLAFYLCLLTGAVRELSAYWEAQAEAAVLEERRRVARDLHDGLTQELALIWAQSRLLSRDPGNAAAVDRVAGAAGRALDEARRSIAALTRPLDEPFPVVLERFLEDLAGRYDVAITAELEPAAAPSSGQSEQLLRITGEAVRNAVVHGTAQHLVVQLSAAPLRMVVRDDGSGFDPSAPRRSGFGMTSMQERATAAGAQFAVASAPGEGAAVRVEWS